MRQLPVYSLVIMMIMILTMITMETPSWGMACRTSLFSGNNDDNDNDNDNNGDTSLGYGLQNQVIQVILW